MKINFQQDKKIKIFLILFWGIIFLALILKAMFGTYLYTNTSASASLGLYAATFNQSIKADGAYYIVRLPYAIPALRAKKNLLMLKKIRGKAGDQYTVTDNSLIYNGTAYPRI